MIKFLWVTQEKSSEFWSKSSMPEYITVSHLGLFYYIYYKLLDTAV